MMMTKTGVTLALLPLAVILTGCGGGGGGSSSATLGGFTSFTAAARNSAISLSGMSQEASYTYNTSTSKVASLGPISSGDNATASITYDSSGNTTTAQYTSANGTSLNFSRANGDIFGYLRINNNIDVAISADGTKYILAANPHGFQWDYQTFGTWVTGAGTGSGQVGFSSMGATTSSANIPTTGAATYSGYTGGRYSAANGDDYFTSSSLTANANFANRTLAVTSSNTQVTRDLLSASSNSNLNFTGSLAYNSGSNQFTGNITTTGGLNGTMTGKFYGPSANEIGGVFATQPSGVQLYGGSFGAKR